MPARVPLTGRLWRHHMTSSSGKLPAFVRWWARKGKLALLSWQEANFWGQVSLAPPWEELPWHRGVQNFLDYMHRKLQFDPAKEMQFWGGNVACLAYMKSRAASPSLTKENMELFILINCFLIISINIINRKERKSHDYYSKIFQAHIWILLK